MYVRVSACLSVCLCLAGWLSVCLPVCMSCMSVSLSGHRVKTLLGSRDSGANGAAALGSFRIFAIFRVLPGSCKLDQAMPWTCLLVDAKGEQQFSKIIAEKRIWICGGTLVTRLTLEGELKFKLWVFQPLNHNKQKCETCFPTTTEERSQQGCGLGRSFLRGGPVLGGLPFGLPLQTTNKDLPLKTPSPGEANLLQTYSPCYPKS